MVLVKSLSITNDRGEKQAAGLYFQGIGEAAKVLSLNSGNFVESTRCGSLLFTLYYSQPYVCHEWYTYGCEY